MERGLYVKSKIPCLKEADFLDCHVDFNFYSTKTENEDKVPLIPRPELIFDKFAMVCMTTKGSILHKFFTGLQDHIFPLCNFIFRPDGLYITEPEKESKLCVLTHLASDKFLNYYCPREFFIQIDLQSLLTKFEKIRKVGYLLIIKCSKVNQLDFDIIVDTKKNKNKSFSETAVLENEVEGDTSYALQEVNFLGLEATFPFKMIIPTEFLKKMQRILTAKSKDKTLNIHVNDKSLTFKVGKEEETRYNDLVLAGGGVLADEKITLEIFFWKKVMGFIAIMKLPWKKSKVTLCYGAKHPYILVLQDVGNLGRTIWVLSQAEQ